MNLNTISYITLWVQQYDESLAFYRDLLGLEVEQSDENFTQFATQGIRFYLHRLGAAPQLREHTVEIHFPVPDVDEAYRTLAARGIVFEQAPANMPWGTRMAAFRDPEGYALEIVGPLNPDEPVRSY
jgi:catechol 2,3-dioxygenase-like lactoylglutathione lyase family enzyme